MPGLTIRQITASHIYEIEVPKFEIVRNADGKTVACAPVPSPIGYPVDGRPSSDLRSELAWYFERFLDYPFPPESDHAQRVQDALARWGRDAFEALFSQPNAVRWFGEAIRDGLENLELRISSDDPRVLAWPWEALNDPQTGTLAHTCRIERGLNVLADPPDLADSLPQDRVNVLLVICRPYGDRDVGYRSISRHLVKLAEERRLPVQVTVLRPPTFNQLQRHLRERPGHYHLLHFDGHGVFAARKSVRNPALPGGTVNPHLLSAHQRQGHLVFETAEGEADPKSAEDLTLVLREHRVPAAILNACQSAMIDDQADDPFTSVAAALVKAGVRRVVAMSYSLYVSAAQEFLPAFYERLFETGQFEEAVRAGRQRLRLERGRVCARGRYELDDWLVPVLYSQGTEQLDFQSAGRQAPATELPNELTAEQNPYGFIGRDGALLQLERALHRAPGVLLITGLGGIGKTTLTAGFVEWLLRTDGLQPNQLFWFRFDAIHNAEYVLNRLGERMFGPQFCALGLDQKLTELTSAFKQQRYLIVWDNFEGVHGIAGTDVTPKLLTDDRELLADFARRLKGGVTKIVLTSRSDEDWLEKAYRFQLRLGGLNGEDRWELYETIVKELGLRVDRDDPVLKELLDLLDGHPLAMRVVLPELEGRSAASVLHGLQADVDKFDSSGREATEQKLFATLRFATEQFPSELKPMLVPLALHERFVQAELLENMGQSVDAAQWTQQRIAAYLHALSVAGLIQNRGNTVFELHPLLTRYLRTSLPTDDIWIRAFVEVMGRLADQLTPQPVHEQRGPFRIHGENFQAARRHANSLEMGCKFAKLTQSLAVYAHNTHSLVEAEQLFTDFAESCRRNQNDELEAVAYHELGRIAAARHDYNLAEDWARKSLEIAERSGNDAGAATNYHQLGKIAAVRRDYASAEDWYRKSLEIDERLGNEDSTAMNYHHLGRIAEKRRDYSTAEDWYRKAVTIFERLGIEQHVASIYNDLGRIAEERDEDGSAEDWYRKSLEIKERVGNEAGAALSYHQMGNMAAARGNYASAEDWYQKSLKIKERLGNNSGAANTYHQLGVIAQSRRDEASAKEWYRKAVAVFEHLGIEQHSAKSYLALGILEHSQQRFLDAAKWCIKSIQAFQVLQDEAGVEHGLNNLTMLYREAPSDERAAILSACTDASLPFLPVADKNDYDPYTNEEP